MAERHAGSKPKEEETQDGVQSIRSSHSAPADGGGEERGENGGPISATNDNSSNGSAVTHNAMTVETASPTHPDGTPSCVSRPERRNNRG